MGWHCSASTGRPELSSSESVWLWLRGGHPQGKQPPWGREDALTVCHSDGGTLVPTRTLELQALLRNLGARKTFPLVDTWHSPHLIKGIVLTLEPLLPQRS